MKKKEKSNTIGITVKFSAALLDQIQTICYLSEKKRSTLLRKWIKDGVGKYYAQLERDGKASI